jgi:uncharacterized protein DUF3501
MTSVITLDDVINFFEYEKEREARRRGVIVLKQKRRLEVGPYLSFVFENRETLLFQIQEMCRAERIIDEPRLRCKKRSTSTAHCCPVPASYRPACSSRSGTNSRSSLCSIGSWASTPVGTSSSRSGGLVVPGSFEAGDSDEEKGKLAAVHFAFPAEAVYAFPASDVDLLVDHPATREHPPYSRNRGRTAHRPGSLTGARVAGRAGYCMIKNQT